MNLTPDQLLAIDRHLRKENWLLNESLIAELTDHYVAGISDRMLQGQAFSEALIEVYKGFGWRKGLLKMEEDYQTQKERQNNLAEWREMKPFFTGPRAFVTIAVFTGLYQLNSSAEADSFLNMGSLFLLLGFVSAFFVMMTLKLIHGRTTGESWSTPGILIARIYSLCYSTLFLGKFIGAMASEIFPAGADQFINATLQTLTAVYFMGAATTLYQQLFLKTKPA